MPTWISGNCTAIPFPLSPAGDGNSYELLRYLREVFALSHRLPVYIVLEPTAIPTKVRDIKKYIVLPPYSAIVCGDADKIGFGEVYRVEESFWAKAATIQPYTLYPACGSLKYLDLRLAIEELKGVPYLCIDTPTIDAEMASNIIRGGIIEITSKSEEVSQELAIPILKDCETLFLKNVLIRATGKFRSLKVRFSPINIDKTLAPYAQALVLVSNKPVAVKLGRGYVFALDVDIYPALLLYCIIILNTFLKHAD